MKMKIKDISGLRFGKIVAKEYVGSDNHGEAMWKCICDCGNTCIVRGSNLRTRKNYSCGCSKNTKNNTNRKDITKMNNTVNTNNASTVKPGGKK